MGGTVELVFRNALSSCPSPFASLPLAFGLFLPPAFGCFIFSCLFDAAVCTLVCLFVLVASPVTPEVSPPVQDQVTAAQRAKQEAHNDRIVATFNSVSRFVWCSVAVLLWANACEMFPRHSPLQIELHVKGVCARMWRFGQCFCAESPKCSILNAEGLRLAFFDTHGRQERKTPTFLRPYI